MANLLGDLWAGGAPRWENACAVPGVALHLYGKKEPRPGRKMGHLTALADTPRRPAGASSTRAPPLRARFESETSMKNPLVPALLLAFGAALAAAAGIPESLDATNYKRLSPSLAVAGRPSRRRSRRSRRPASGRRSTSASRPRECAAAREAVEAQGLTFVSVPVSPGTFSPRGREEGRGGAQGPGRRPVLLYCSSSNRVGGVIAVVEIARAHERRGDRRGKKAGLKSAAMEKAALDVMDRQR